VFCTDFPFVWYVFSPKGGVVILFLFIYFMLPKHENKVLYHIL